MVTHELDPAVQWLEKDFDARWETYGNVRDVPACIYGDDIRHHVVGHYRLYSADSCPCERVMRYMCTGWNEGSSRRIPGLFMQLRRDD